MPGAGPSFGPAQEILLVCQQLCEGGGLSSGKTGINGLDGGLADEVHLTAPAGHKAKFAAAFDPVHSCQIRSCRSREPATQGSAQLLLQFRERLEGLVATGNSGA